MKHIFVKIPVFLAVTVASLLFVNCSSNKGSLDLSSKDGANKIILSLNENGELYYQVKRNDNIIINNSSLGLKCDDQDFTKGLTVASISPIKNITEKYQLTVANNKQVNQEFKTKSITLKNSSGGFLIVDLIAGKEGVAFRYRFPDEQSKVRVVENEITTFKIDEEAKGWLQPYNKAGDYTPGYEDFYLNVSSGDPITNARNPSVGWCMPALFNVNNNKNWVLIAEAGTDGTYTGCHLGQDSEGGIYKIAFAKKDERVTVPIDEKASANPISKLPWTMPWRVVIIGDQAGDILLSTLITDLAPASKIEDISWIQPGKASWSWWSHPDDSSVEMYNEFTDLAVSFGWEYTLFDAGWQEANKKGAIISNALSKGIKPMVWGYSSNYFHSDERQKRFKDLSEMGVKGVKIDFWCSDRQETMGVLQSLFKDAAAEHLLVNLHGTTIPRGWHRTWPNFMTAEAVLGTESYFYEKKFPEKAAEQNTVLPFTRNVAGPTDYTPIALTIRKYPRLNTAVHELASPMIYTSGVIHFADSKEVFESLPMYVKTLLKEMPATWDKTTCIIGEPGKAIVLSRKKDAKSYIVGINGTNKEMPITLNLKKYSENFTHFKIITEGKDPLMEFASNTYSLSSDWSYTMAPKGGFIIQFINNRQAE